MTPRVLAHRGLCVAAPENTVAALEAARKAGCAGAEVDLRWLGDGTLALHHDAKSSNGRRLKALRRHQWRGDTWADLEAWGRRHPHFFLDLEVKEAGADAVLAPFLKGRKDGSFAVTTFDAAEAARLAARHAKWTVGWITKSRRRDVVRSAQRLGVRLLVVPYRLATNARISDANKAGLPLMVWGDFAPEATRAWPAGAVDAVIVDDPLRWFAATRPREGTSRGRSRAATRRRVA